MTHRWWDEKRAGHVRSRTAKQPYLPHVPRQLSTSMSEEQWEEDHGAEPVFTTVLDHTPRRPITIYSNGHWKDCSKGAEAEINYPSGHRAVCVWCFTRWDDPTKPLTRRSQGI